jgi:catechol 2,3-dioxygenase-like lactoylglutathione lyase family enzyme
MASIYKSQGVRLPRLQHVSLPIRTGTQDTIRTFYGNLLGFTQKPVPTSLAGRGLVWFAVGNSDMELHLVSDTYLAHPEEGRHICFEVDDLEQYRDRLMQAGYPIEDPITIPGRPRFFTKDPSGNRLEITTIEADYRESM